MLILVALFPLLFAGDICDSVPATHPEFAKLETEVEKKLRKSSHLVTIASEADAVLAKLLSHKSPVLVDWINKRQLMNKKEEEIAGEWRFYYLNEFILSKYPTPTHAINTSVETVFEDINKLAFPQTEKTKIEAAFKRAQQDAVLFIKTLALDSDTESLLVKRIQDIELYWFSKLKGSRYQNKPLEFLKWGLAYDPPHNQINVGLYTRKHISTDSLYGVFAHEIGHAIDPCRWGAFIKVANPFTDLYTCLRQEKTAGAKPRDDSKMALMIKKNRLTTEMAQSLKDNPLCNRSFYPPVGTQKEQLVEVFADWFSAEVLAHSSQALKQIRPDLCRIKKISKGSSYLKHQQRLSRIYATQPQLQKKFGFISDFSYCPFKLKKAGHQAQ